MVLLILQIPEAKLSSSSLKVCTREGRAADMVVTCVALNERAYFDVSPENDDSFENRVDGGFGSPRRKKRIHEAVTIH